MSSPGHDVNEALAELARRDAELGSAASELFGDSPLSPDEYAFPDREPFSGFDPRFVPSRRLWPRLMVAIGNRVHSRRGDTVGHRPRSGSARVHRFGDWVAFVGPGCLLHAETGVWIEDHGVGAGADLLYGDSIHFGGGDPGQSVHQLRPGWSPERLRAHCYVGEVVLARRALVRRAGGTRRLRRLSSHDRALRLAEASVGVARIPKLLYASPYDQRLPSVDAAAVERHCGRTGVRASVEKSPDGTHVRVLRSTHDRPRTAVIIPTRGTSSTVFGKDRILAVTAVESLLRSSGGFVDEVIVVFDSDTPNSAREAILSAAGPRARWIDCAGPFNFARKINLAAVSTEADQLLLLNDDVEIAEPDLLPVLSGYLEDPGVGMVAPLLLFEDGTVQSAGHLLNPSPFDLYRGYPPGLTGGSNMLLVARESTSVIAAVALTRRSDFLEAGGLCEGFPGDYNDVDYSLKLSLRGKRTIVTPYVRCWHFESKTRRAVPDSGAIARLGARWRRIIEDDPLGNPGLQPHEFIWKSDVDKPWSLDEAMGRPAQWDDEEWSRLMQLGEFRLHRTMYFPGRIKWLS